MNAPSIEDVEQAIVDAVIPSIENYIQRNKDNIFVAFAVETLTEEGYFHMCALTLDECKKEKYKGALRPDYIEWNCQEWNDFDFNGSCEIWKSSWNIGDGGRCQVT